MPEDNLQIVAVPGTREGVNILQLKGPLNIRTLFAFHDAVRKDTPKALILDLEGVPYMDSAGLGSLVAASVAGQKAGYKLALTGINKKVYALLDMTHVLQCFQVFPTVKDAEAGAAAQIIDARLRQRD